MKKLQSGKREINNETAVKQHSVTPPEDGNIHCLTMRTSNSSRYWL